MGVSKSKPPFSVKKLKSEIVQEEELKVIELFLSGCPKLSSYLNVYPEKEKLSNSELLKEVENLFSLPRYQKIIRERTAKNGK